MNKLKSFSVLANIPDKLAPLKTLASNLWFSWNFSAIDVFRRLDPDRWEKSRSNPKFLLNTIPQEKYNKALLDESFLSYMHTVFKKYVEYFSDETWYSHQYSHVKQEKNHVIAYFSLEFGLDESLPIYSGGLGILAGDHLKAASDLGLPLIGVGLLYRQGYFKQYLNSDGWQQELYPDSDFFNIPVQPMLDNDQNPYIIEVQCKKTTIYCQLWRSDVGRVPLLLLDANIPQNSPEDRLITSRLYGGDIEMRIKQEILIGIGGLRALERAGYNPIVCHMNEGHAAFLSLERIRSLMAKHQLSLGEAKELVKATNVFTTHTPVPAGNDRFEIDIVYSYLEGLLNEIGMSKQGLFDLAREKYEENKELFCMTVLALNMAAFSNGVSELHGVVSRKMWQKIWPELPESEIPIQHITNGIHIRTWISHDLGDLYDRYLGPKWGRDPEETEIWNRVHNIPDIELWGTHERRRERLVSFARRRLTDQFARRGATIGDIKSAQEVLNPKALTIGFAKRFATYKRAALIFSDLDRLKKILCNDKQPVQLIFSGKAHPLDNPGKRFIQMIVHYARLPEFKNKIVFIEDYDMNVGRYLVQGCDVWLNNPRRPLEASGTSGMKAAANGVLNLSVLDGWWVEAYHHDNGWAIGSGEEYDDENVQDEVESMNIYDLLEEEVIPMFYKRGVDGLPRDWINRMKNCISSISPVFNTTRMVSEYAKKFYIPCLESYNTLTANDFGQLKDFTNWINTVRHHWGDVLVLRADSSSASLLKVGDQSVITATLQIHQLAPQDIKVELYYGLLDSNDKIEKSYSVPMAIKETLENNRYLYEATLTCESSGKYGYAVRALPHHPLMSGGFEPRLITWNIE